MLSPGARERLGSEAARVDQTARRRGGRLASPATRPNLKAVCQSWPDQGENRSRFDSTDRAVLGADRAQLAGARPDSLAFDSARDLARPRRFGARLSATDTIHCGVFRQHARHHLQQRRFAGAVLPHHRPALAASNGQVQAVVHHAATIDFRKSTRVRSAGPRSLRASIRRLSIRPSARTEASVTSSCIFRSSD